MGMSAMAAALVMLLLTSIATSAGILREGIASLSSSSSPTQCPWACNASLPSFQWQARIANVSGGPEPSQPTRCYLAGLFDTTIKPPSLATMPGQLGAWSDVGNFSTIHSAFWKAKPSADSIPGHVALPATLRLVGDQGLSTPNASAGFIWTLELKILSCCGEPEATLVAELFSSDSRWTGGDPGWPSLQLLFSLNRTAVPSFALTEAQFEAHRYWDPLFSGLKVSTPPVKFPIADGLAIGSSDLIAWRLALQSMKQFGVSSVHMSKETAVRKLAEELSVGISSGVYNPPLGFADTGVDNSAMKIWVEKQAGPFRSAQWPQSSVGMYAIGDEPGFSLPFMGANGDPTNLSNPSIHQNWREYTSLNDLQPSDFGASSWGEVQLSRRRNVTALPDKKLFYHSMRFLSWSSSRLFARSTAAVEQALWKGFPTFANWNTFSGRFYTPGAPENAPAAARADNNGAKLGNDWLEFGRLKGGNLLWTEDWAPDYLAPQWSYFASKLRSAARLAPVCPHCRSGSVSFGGYVVPVSSNWYPRPDGVMMRTLALVGSGAKAVEYFEFGPEFNFPGNCWSELALERPYTVKSMAHGHQLIGAAEELLWPAERVRAQVAILHPRSSYVWDETDVSQLAMKVMAGKLASATGTYLGSALYNSEIFGLYTALAIAMNTPVDFVDEDALLDENIMSKYQLIVVTEPNLPSAALQALLHWARNGGTLMTIPNAATRDEYDEAMVGLQQARGFSEEPRRPLIIPSYGYTPLYTSVHPLRCYEGAWPHDTCTPSLVANGTVDTEDGHEDGCHSVELKFCAASRSQGQQSCLACAARHAVEIVAAGCTDGAINSFCSDQEAPSRLSFSCWGAVSTPTLGSTVSGEKLATFANEQVAAMSDKLGDGQLAHFFFFPGFSHMFQAAVETPPIWLHTAPVFKVNIFPGNSSAPRAAIEAVLRKVLVRAGVQPSVNCSVPHVETPLLRGPRGDVVTVLNWAYRSCWDHAKVHWADVACAPMELELNVSLGYVPSIVRSAERGLLSRRKGPGAGWSVAEGGKLRVQLAVGSADFLLFFK